MLIRKISVNIPPLVMSKSLLLKLQFSFPINKHGSNTYRLLKVTVCTGHCHLCIELVSRNYAYSPFNPIPKQAVLNPTATPQRNNTKPY